MHQETMEEGHPLRRLFRSALDFGLQYTPTDKQEVADYLEDQVLCEFIHTDRLYKIKDPEGRCLEDIADMFNEGSVLIHAQSFQREFLVHKHIGDYTLFMLGMFPKSLSRRKGKEFTLGKIVVPGASLSEHYMLQGQRSYRIASEFTNGDIFLELSANFLLYKNLLEMVRIYLEEACFGQ
ncbi:MAG: hypothetical protein JSU90_11640 [Nitrospiraceae bacterium]|nr:MAG: hypothetical protein JSU90_11640 [Nitrospiraceae bacterium]